MHPAWLDAARSAARRCGMALIAAPATWRVPDNSNGRDLKLRADREAEALILRELEPTSLPVLAEESGASATFSDAQWAWVVDPLDGTFNYQRGFQVWCVSIGLLNRGEPVAGAIFDGVSQRIVTGVVGGVAMDDDRTLRVTSTADLKQAALVTGLPVGGGFSPGSLVRFVTDAVEFKKVRMLGSAASALVSVARGQFDAYYEDGIALWDIAAGVAIVRAAGGEVRIGRPASNHRYAVYAGNGIIRPSVREACGSMVDDRCGMGEFDDSGSG